jgi:hypothetical protein
MLFLQTLQIRDYGNLAGIEEKSITLRRIALRGGMNWKKKKRKPPRNNRYLSMPILFN